MKNLTVQMPLAVPHQRPPNKLRSHLYPIFLSDDMTLQASITGTGELRSVYQATNIGMDSTQVQASITGTGELKQVFITYDNKFDAVSISASISGTGTLQ